MRSQRIGRQGFHSIPNAARLVRAWFPGIAVKTARSMSSPRRKRGLQRERSRAHADLAARGRDSGYLRTGSPTWVDGVVTPGRRWSGSRSRVRKLCVAHGKMRRVGREPAGVAGRSLAGLSLVTSKSSVVAEPAIARSQGARLLSSGITPPLSLARRADAPPGAAAAGRIVQADRIIPMWRASNRLSSARDCADRRCPASSGRAELQRSSAC